MLQAKTRWTVREGNRQKAKQLMNELQLTPLVANLLVNRGLDTAESVKKFLNPDEEFHHPFLLHDMDICVERIFQAIRNRERMVVYGDYDADGVTSTYVLLKTLRELGADADFYIPNRFWKDTAQMKKHFEH